MLLAFAVDDIVSARVEHAAAYVELVRAPDGNILVVQQNGLPATE